MTTIAEVRSGLAAACVTVSGVAASAYPTDQIVTHTVYVHRLPFDPRLIFTGSKAEHDFRLTVFANRAAETSSATWLEALAELSGSGSLIAAVQTSANWGSVSVDYAQVVNVGEVQVAEVAGVAYFVVSFDVKVVW